VLSTTGYCKERAEKRQKHYDGNAKRRHGSTPRAVAGLPPDSSTANCWASKGSIRSVAEHEQGPRKMKMVRQDRYEYMAINPAFKRVVIGV
jgi:hypothetical protein